MVFNQSARCKYYHRMDIQSKVAMGYSTERGPVKLNEGLTVSYQTKFKGISKVNEK